MQRKGERRRRSKKRGSCGVKLWETKINIIKTGYREWQNKSRDFCSQNGRKNQRLRHSDGGGSSLKEYWTGWKIMSQLAWLFGSKKLASVMENYQVKWKKKKNEKGKVTENTEDTELDVCNGYFSGAEKLLYRFWGKNIFFQNGRQTNEVKYYVDLPKKTKSD